MGFRRPATSATAVATAGAGTARVRIFESADGRGNPIGVVSLEDGVPGDTPSTLSAGAFSPTGGAVTLAAGAFGGITGPKLALQVDQAGLSSAQLTATDGFLVNGQAWAQQRAWRFERSAQSPNPSDTFNSTSGVAPLLDRTITAAPAGDYLVACQLMLSGSGAAIGFQTLQAGAPASLSSIIGGTPRADLTGNVLPYGCAGVIQNWPGGDLRIYAAFQVSTAGVTATIQTVGSALSVAYLGPRT